MNLQICFQNETSHNTDRLNQKNPSHDGTKQPDTHLALKSPQYLQEVTTYLKDACKQASEYIHMEQYNHFTHDIAD